MNQRFKTALLTTLKQLPMIGWQWLFLAMALPQRQALPEGVGAWVGGSILLIMIGLTFWVAYKTERINQRPLLIYHLIWVIPVMVIALKMLWVAPVGLFLLSLYLYARPLNRLFGKDAQDHDLTISAKDMVEPLKQGIEADEQKVDKVSNLNSFEDLLKRGNLPDDDREIPNWLKIKNRQFDDVDVSHNTVDDIITLTSPEFNEFASSADNGLLLTYLSTLSEGEMNRFYQYCDDVVKLDKSKETRSAKEVFQAALEKTDQLTRTHEAIARATLEIPLMINFSKNIYHKIMDYMPYVQQNYYNYEADDALTAYEEHLVKIIWAEMKYIPNHFEPVLDQFKGFYDEENEEHKKFFVHLANRFGMLIATLNRLVVMTEERETSLNWFTGKMVEYDCIGSTEISISQSKALTTDQKLINFLTTTFAGICDEHDDNYLISLICVVETLFEWYPVNRPACEYAMVEMMKFVAIKEVSVENANCFLNFFAELPRFYAVLNYDKIYELKELINHTLANHKPQDNEIFDHADVKNRLVLMNYLVDMEDLYYESGQGLESTEEKQQYEIEYYDDTDNSGCYYVCMNEHYIFRANGSDPQPQWEFVNFDYEAWDFIHQKIYRNFRCKKINKEALPVNLPSPPDTIPPEEKKLPPEPVRADEFPALAAYLSKLEAKLQNVDLILHEDLYESIFGDGKFCYSERLFFDSEGATHFKNEHDDRERYTLYHIRSGAIRLNDKTLECDIDKYVFDHFDDKGVFTLAESVLSKIEASE